MMTEDHGVAQINATAEKAYAIQGPGVGAGKTVWEWLENLTTIKLSNAHRVLDVGFGEGESLCIAMETECELIAGVDIAQASINNMCKKFGVEEQADHLMAYVGRAMLRRCDVSKEPLPFAENMFNLVVCTETFEHLSDPYFAMAEMKRVLEPDGLLLMAFPMPEDNYGYGGGQHAHVYPGFLEQESYELFMRQMYFHVKRRLVNGSSAWYAWRNYKGPGIVDVFHMIAGNYTEEQLYGMLHD